MNSRILIIEDNADNLALMTYLLQAFGHTALAAINGQQGIEAARKERPDLIICDVHLPDMDGCEIARWLKSDPELRSTPLVAVTALAMVGDRERLLASGFDSYLSKPIDPEWFVPQMEEFLCTRHLGPLPSTATAPSPEPPAATGKTILVVDNRPINLELAHGIMEPFGYRVITAGGMAEGLAAARREPCDLILSDVCMAEGSGYDFLQAVRADPHLCGLPFVFITSTMLNEKDRATVWRRSESVPLPAHRPRGPAGRDSGMSADESWGVTMPTLLVVDDHPTNRDFLVTLLRYRGHRLLEAADGAEALALARADRPDLVIADILMPTMDGYEFVRQLRADAALAGIPVIFYTAHYHEREARVLADAVGVTHVLTKPAEPEVILSTVDTVLGAAVPPVAQAPPEEFDREHLRLLTDKLSANADELRRANERLTTLIDLGLDLGSERDPQRLLQRFCSTAREIIGARYAVVGVLDNGGSQLRYFFTSGMSSDLVARLGLPDTMRGGIPTVLRERRCLRLTNPTGDPQALDFPAGYPPFRSWMGPR